MPDDSTTQAETAEEQNAETQAETAAETTAEAVADTDTSGADAKPDAATNLIKKLRAEIKGHEKARKAAETKLKDKEDAELSEVDRAKNAAAEAEKQVEALQAQVKDVQTEAKIATACSDLGVVDAEAATVLLKARLGEDDDVKAALTALLNEKPYLKAKANGAGGSVTNPASNKGGGVTRAQLQSMSRDEILALDPKDVDKALAAA